MSIDATSVATIMRKRGYELHSTIRSNDKTIGYNYYKNTGLKFIDGRQQEQEIIIHAQVSTQSYTVELSFVDLPMLMQIKTTDVSFTHPDFKRFEDYIIRYAQVCTKQRL